MAVIVPAYGTFAYGQAGYGTAVGGASTGPDGLTGEDLQVIFLEANDRNQIVACISDGLDRPPDFVYWNPAPAAWGEALSSPYPGDFPTFYALDGGGAAVEARWESAARYAGDDEEWRVAGVLVELAVRPTQMDGFDGGLDALVPTFTLHVEGWGVPGTATTSSVDSRSTSVVASASYTWSAADDQDVSLAPWPATRAVFAPTRLAQGVRSYRIVVTAHLGVEFLSFSPVGTRHIRRA